MHAVRQAASALVYGIISLLLVLGSLALAQAQGGPSRASAPTFTPLPSSTATPSAPASALSNTATSVAAATTVAVRPTDTPTLVPSTPTKTRAAPRPTAANQLTCAPQYGWESAYVVESGDTLYRIARRYGVTVDALQRANCRTTTLIYVGEHLWVPYGQPAATALTVIPTFPTPTESAATASADP